MVIYQQQKHRHHRRRAVVLLTTRDIVTEMMIKKQKQRRKQQPMEMPRLARSHQRSAVNIQPRNLVVVVLVSPWSYTTSPRAERLRSSTPIGKRQRRRASLKAASQNVLGVNGIMLGASVGEIVSLEEHQVQLTVTYLVQYYPSLLPVLTIDTSYYLTLILVHQSSISNSKITFFWP